MCVEHMCATLRGAFSQFTQRRRLAPYILYSERYVCADVFIICCENVCVCARAFGNGNLGAPREHIRVMFALGCLVAHSKPQFMIVADCACMRSASPICSICIYANKLLHQAKFWKGFFFLVPNICFCVFRLVMKGVPNNYIFEVG